MTLLTTYKEQIDLNEAEINEKELTEYEKGMLKTLNLIARGLDTLLKRLH